MTSADSILKVHYTNDMIMRMTYQDHPFFALMPKMTDFGGKNLPIPIIYGAPQGRSSSFAIAQANKRASKFKDFTLTRAKDYGLASIDGETIDATRGNNNAFIEALTSEVDGVFESLTGSLASSLFRSGSGSIGKIASTTNVTTDTIVLTNAEDSVNFELGQILVASAADGGGTVKASGAVQNAAEIIGIDRILGTLKMSVTLDSFGSNDWAAADYLFVQGDYDLKVKGLEAWIPAVAPTSALFFGVDRSSDPVRLGGMRKDVSNMPLEEGLVDGLMLANREGANLSHYFLNYANFGLLEKSLGSKCIYVDVNTTAGIAFRGIQINNPKGKPVTVLADQSCQDDVAWGLQMDTWKLYSLGSAPKLLNQDGNKVLREATEDGVEVRCGYYAQVGCRGPGRNIRLKIK